MLSIAQIAQYAEAAVRRFDGREPGAVAEWAERHEIQELLTDSRYLRRADVCLFVALKTAKNDGHRYIPELYGKGVRTFLVSELPEAAASRFPEAVFLLAGDTLAALQRLSAAYRRRFDLPVVGITGSNGKTVVKEWLSGLLSPDCRVVKSPKSYNSQIGVPLSLWEIQPWHEIGIFEAGISQPGEMAALARMIRPTVGILTNVGAAHAAYFADNRQKAAEKLQLFHGAEKLIYCADDALITAAIAADPALKGVRRLAWSARLSDGFEVMSDASLSSPAAQSDACLAAALPFGTAACRRGCPSGNADGLSPDAQPDAMPAPVLRLIGREEVSRGGRRYTRLTAVYDASAGLATPASHSTVQSTARLAASLPSGTAARRRGCPSGTAARRRGCPSGNADGLSSVASQIPQPVTHQIEVPFTDAASLENVMHCWLFLLDRGMASSEIASRMAQLAPVAMRMELKEGINGNYLINDAYNSDFDAFGLAVDYLVHQSQGRRKRVVLSDILQSGSPAERLYQEVADLLHRHRINAFVGIGPELMRHQALFAAEGMETVFYPDTETFLQTFDPQVWHEEVILLKGARPFAFERIAKRLQKKVHETVMEIDLDAMIHNLNFFRSRLKPQTKVMIMAKAFSYGSGSYEVANALAFHRSDYITVAYADEGVSLRKKGIGLPIMVVNAEAEGLESVLQYRLEPEIYSFRMLSLLREQLRHLPAGAGASATVAIHVKLDTGMHRLGFEEADLDRLLTCLSEEPRLRVRSIFTHLATADEPSMDAYTLAQLQRFDRMSAYLKTHLPYGDDILRHALNTAGICRFPEYQYDMVRLGIGLYGVGVTAEMEGQLETVSTFKTTIAQIRTIAAGEAVGYGRRFMAERPMRIGVLCVGYADGLNRRLSRGVGRVWIHGKTAPIIGNICMDMCMLDLTGIEAEEGDEVILFGRDWPVTQMADALQTIPYEVLTGISPRVKRVYYQA